MTGAVTVERCRDPEAWDQFVVSEGGPPFTYWGWGSVLEAVYDHDRHFFVARSGGEIVGAAPLFYVSSRLFGDQLVSLPFASRGSLVVGDAHCGAAIHALLDRIRTLADALEVDYVSLRSRDLGADPHPAFEHKRRWVAFEVPLEDGPDAVWEALKGNRRTHVRNGRENLEVRVGDSLADLRDFYDLYLKSMRGHGTPPHSFTFFQRVWEEFYEQGNLRLYLAKTDGRPVNATLELLSEEWVYHWKEVSDYEYRDLDGGSLLVWKGIEWAAENEYRRFDLGRTREGSGVYMYKKTFGGEKTWMDDYHYFPSGSNTLPNPDDEKYEPVKRVWRKLPLSVTRVVGPRIRKEISL